MDHYSWKTELVKNALYHYATILNKSVLELNVVQMSIEFVKANLVTESYFVEELIEYITKKGTIIDTDTDTGNTIRCHKSKCPCLFHYNKIRRTILNALDCYVDGLKNTIKIMASNSSDPRSDFYAMEQEIKLCTRLKKEIEQYGNITSIRDKSLF